LHQSTLLNNGIQVISERMDTVRSVSLGAWFRVGSRDELPGQYGLSHFMEHMFFKGTNKRDALTISQDFESLGAEQNAFTSKEYTCYYARMVDEKLPAVFEVLSDMLTGSLFEQKSIDSEREVVIEEIARSEDTPDDYVFELFSEALFPGHPLGRQIAGSRQSVSAFMHADCERYRQQHYHTGNCIIVACGNVAHEQLVELVERYFATLPQGEAAQRGEAPAKTPGSLKLLQKETEQAHLVYGMPGVALGDADRFAAKLLDAALGGGMSSRLFQEIREKRGLVYAVYATTISYINAGSFLVYAGTRPEKLAEVVSLVRLELQRLLAAGMSADELQRMKDYLIGTLVLGMESTANRMMRIGRSAVADQEMLGLDELIGRYQAVSLEQTRQVAERVLAAEPTLAVISPNAPEQLREVLAGAMAAD